MNKLLFYFLKRKHNSNELTYGKTKINQIIMKYKSAITNKFYEETNLNTNNEQLQKFYPKEISWLLLTKICLFNSNKKEQSHYPLFKDLYWSNYIINYYAVKFEFVNLNRFSEYDYLDISLKTFFNSERIDEFEKEDYIQYKNADNVSKRKKEASKQSYEDLVNFIFWIDYEERLARVKQNEKKKHNLNFGIEENADNNVNTPFRRFGTKRFGCLKLMRSKKQKELNVLVKEEEKIAVQNLIKPEKKENSKFKTIESFKKIKKEKCKIKASIETSIKTTLKNLYQAKGFLFLDKTRNKIQSSKKKRKFVIEHATLSKNMNSFEKIGNDYNRQGNTTNKSQIVYKDNNKETSLPKIHTPRTTTHRITKVKGMISLKKPHLNQILQPPNSDHTILNNSTIKSVIKKTDLMHNY